MSVTRNPNRGVELGYAEITSDATFTSVYNTRTDIVGLSTTVTVGSRPIILEFGVGQASSSVAAGIVIVEIMEGSTSVGFARIDVSGTGKRLPMYCRRRLTPSAGSHTYKIVGSVGAASTGTVYAATDSPAWLQVTEV